MPAIEQINSILLQELQQRTAEELHITDNNRRKYLHRLRNNVKFSLELKLDLLKNLGYEIEVTIRKAS